MKIFRIITVFALTVFLCSCAGKQQKVAQDQPKAAAEVEKQEYANVSRLEGVSMETVQKEPKLSAKYDNIVLNPLQTSPQLATDYPDVSMQFQISVLSQLKDKKKYKRVESVEANQALSGFKGNTLIVDTKVTDMRIVSTGARIWAGAFAGASFMDVYVKLTDASTRKVVLEKIVSSQNNAFASAWAPGTENALPIDMGKIVGEYFAAIVPAK